MHRFIAASLAVMLIFSQSISTSADAKVQTKKRVSVKAKAKHVVLAPPILRVTIPQADLVQQALDEAAAVGMRTLAANATALLAKAVAADDKESYPAGLTRREVQVLRLIATGKGNREIADCLFLSSNTVANHVRNILAKTNTANRTEAAAFALRASLVDRH